MGKTFNKDAMFIKFCAYGFLKNLNFFEPFMLLFFLEKGFSFLQIGTLFSIQFVAVNILQIPTGVFADAVGRRRTMMIAFSSYIISFVLFYTTHSFYFLALAMIFFAFGESFRSGTHKAMIFQYLKIRGWENQKVYYYGHTRSWSQTGSAVSALIAAGIVLYSGSYRAVFLASIVPYLLDFMLVATYPAELDGSVKKIRLKTLPGNFKEVLLDLFRAFRHLRTVKSIVNAAAYSGFFDAFKSYLQPVLKTLALSLPLFMYLDNQKRSAIVVGVVYFFLYLQTAYFARISGRIAERFRNLSVPLNLTLAAGLLLGVGSGVLYHCKFILPAIALYVGIFILHNLRKPMGEAFIAEMVDHEILATALSAEDQVATLIKALLAPLLGLIADHFGIGIAIASTAGTLLLLMPLFIAREKSAARYR